jgi:predicted transcriptional regulator
MLLTVLNLFLQTNMKTVTIHLDKNLLEQCKHLAKKQKITLNQLIVQALTQVINEKKVKKCQTDLI